MYKYKLKKKLMERPAGLSTRAVHAGQPPDPATGAVVPNIVLASTFAQRSPGVPYARESALSYGHGFEYSRTNNPTRAALELCVRDLSEAAQFAVAFASGMAAITSCIQLLKPGDSVAAIADAYGGTLRALNTIAGPTYGITADYCDFAAAKEEETFEQAVARISAVLCALPHKDSTKMVWLESPSIRC